MRSKVTVSNTVGSQCAVSGIHTSTNIAWELYASMIVLMTIQIRLCFETETTKYIVIGSNL